MSGVNIRVAVSGKWKLDGKAVKRLMRCLVSAAIGAGSLWVATHWHELATDTTPPSDGPAYQVHRPGKGLVFARQRHQCPDLVGVVKLWR
ncbi:hypothetical protein [Kribbella sp. NPDC006257]|uniref:hypothetical protein n=1 Tax=Kribbella sp. NPDC006257 TaxID=3156738 RepID=UPI0033A32D57